MMDALKSYFTKMKILPGHGQKSWRFHRKGGKNDSKGKYSRSKSQNDAGYDSPSSMDILEGKENVESVSKTGTLISREPLRESAKSPPAKPPRKDQMFTLNFVLTEGDSLGLELGNTAGNSCMAGSVPDRLAIDNRLHDSIDELSYSTISPIKVVNIIDGSVVQTDGGIQLYDEIIAINGKSIQGESTQGAR